jgi:putative peptidoglycan lipid II flippase
VLAYWLSFVVFANRGWLELGGLALAVSLSSTLEALGLLWLLRRKLHGIDGRDMLDGLWRMSLAGLLMAGAVYLVVRQTVDIPAIWQAVAGGVAGGAVYIAGVGLLRVRELRYLAQFVSRRMNHS